MADRHSSRPGHSRSTARTVGSDASANSPQPAMGSPTFVPTPPPATEIEREIVAELKSVAWRLTAAYCTCVTVQAALEGQAADHDPEFARCLRSGVTDSVSRQVERLQTLVERLGATLPAAPPM